MSINKAFGRFCNKNMVYWDFDKGRPELNAVLFMPYSPKYILNYAEDLQVVYLGYYYNLDIVYFQTPETLLKTNREMLKKNADSRHIQIPSIYEIAKQKLLDLFYLINDLENTQIITMCSGVKSDDSGNEQGQEIASGDCINSMCEKCGLSFNFPGLLHSSANQILKAELANLFKFETLHKFNQKRTLRLSMGTKDLKLHNQLILQEIDKVINTLGDEIQVIPFFNEISERMTHFYIIFENEAITEAIFKGRWRFISTFDPKKYEHVGITKLFPRQLADGNSLFADK